MEVAKNITKESQEVTRIATIAAGACTDSRMKTVGVANDIVDCALQPKLLHSQRAIAGKVPIPALCRVEQLRYTAINFFSN